MDKNKFTFTKIIVLVYSVFFMIWISLSYILAFVGSYEIAEELSSNVVTVGVAAILGYMLKSFFETKESEKIKLEREMNDLSSNDVENYEYNEDDFFNDEDIDDEIIEGDDGNE